MAYHMSPLSVLVVCTRTLKPSEGEANKIHGTDSEGRKRVLAEVSELAVRARLSSRPSSERCKTANAVLVK